MSRKLLRRMSTAVLGGSTRSSDEEDSDPGGAETTPFASAERRKRRLDRALQEDIKEMFQCFDTDNSDALEAVEFCDALALLSIQLDAQKMHHLFEEIDSSNSGDLQMDEWDTMMSRSKRLLLSKSGPTITPEEVRNVVSNILVDLHRHATRVQAVWRGATARKKATSVDERRQHMQRHVTEQINSRARIATVDAGSTNPVSWGLIQPGFARLGVGNLPECSSERRITEERARELFQMVRPSDQHEHRNQDRKSVDDFCDQLYSLLLVPGSGSNPPLFEADDPVETALWRTLIRRYLWLKLLHTIINDSQTMYGARQHSRAVEVEQRMKKQIRKRTCFFEPDAGFRAKWDVFQVFVLLVTAVVVPLRVGFSAMDDNDPKFWFIFDIVSDVYFISDIVINFRTAYISKDRQIEARSKQVCVHYLRTWFIIDLVACLPINYILYVADIIPLPWLKNDGTAGDNGAAEAGDSIKVLKVLRLFRLTKMLRVLKLRTITERYQDSPVYQTFLTTFKLVKLIILLLYLSHFLACFWYLIGTNDEQPTRAKTRYGWVSRYYNDGTWSDYNGNTPTSLATRYVTALFHSLTDFGMEFAETDGEMTWISIQHIIYEAFMAYLTGVLAGEVIVGNAAKQKYSEKMGEIREFMQHHRISRQTRTQVTNFYEHLNAKKTFFDEKEVLNEFPPNIRKQIVLEIYGTDGAPGHLPSAFQLPAVVDCSCQFRGAGLGFTTIA